MSRSYRHTPIVGWTTAAREKKDKRQANRKLRRKWRQLPADEMIVLPDMREVADVWKFAKDGKRWLNQPWPQALRK